MLADGLIHPPGLPGRDPGQHPLEHHLPEQIPGGELPVAVQGDLLAVVRGPRPRAADLHPPTTECDLTVRVAVSLRGPRPVVPALRAHDPVDLPLHRLMQHRQAGMHREREQPFLRVPRDPRKRQLNMLSQHQRRLLSLDDLNNV